MRLVSPTPTYEIELPDDITEQYDERVSSFWREGSSLLLQLSSTVRTEGEQITAETRLAELCKRTPAHWSAFDLDLQDFPGEWAAAQMRDESGVRWVHAYLTTAAVAIYLTISGQPNDWNSDSGWALEAVRSLRFIRPTIH